ncbi:NAD(P)-dependent alcohol dehydrogenase [Planctomonas sp. JC2975]|uniref:NAD(P)-dependent alcohol dehydrogenase n=1 Tax=Planctomonas sp. JC2975 TaxID=2729626 RepID=UPI00147337D4|nr:NAD(P)-dependent alcohol dehydrogenase [Planctomonas sp. JC2975]NNC11709.1 NAD(P)-dependent alcohol dehydrogenase [Planctomonas sp. JC2975]
MPNLAAVMTALNTIEMRERPEPEAGPGEAVVAIRAVGVCGSDVSFYRYGRIGPYVVDGDLILGHEVSGEVLSVGAGVSNVEPGDRVAIEPSMPDWTCEQCRAGRYHLCPNLRFLATPPVDGVLVQRLAIDARTLFRMPDSMTFEEGAIVEPLSVGLWGCQRAGLRPGDDVLVTGAGPVGLLAAEAAKALGARTVTITDVVEPRLELASTHGFATELSGSADRSSRTFDVLLECSGAPGVLADGLGRLGPAGRAAVIGISKQNADLPLHTLNWNEITISMVSRYQNTWPLGIALISSGRVNLEGVHTHSFALADTAAALNIGATDPTAVKAIIYPQDV